jgi:methyl-accepting chemotaxis protein
MADLSIIIETNAKEASKEIGGLSTSISKSAAKAAQMTKAFAFLDKALAKGHISGTHYSAMIDKLDKEESQLYSTLGKTTSGLDQQSAALHRSSKATTNAAAAAEQLANRQRLAGKSTNRFGMYSQQVGYQVGDMVVQIQGGTDALLAFGQQGTQLAGLLPGLAGAVVGIGLSLSTALGKAALQAKGLQVDFKGVVNELKKPLQTIKPLLDGIASAFQSIGSTSKTVLSSLANNLDRVVLYITVAATAFGTKFVAGLIAARFATLTLAGAFAFLRTAIIRTGIGAIIIGVAEAIRMFMLLAKQVGGIGPLLELLKDAFVEQIGKISLMFEWLGLKVKEAFFGIKKNVLKALSDILSQMNSNFVNKFIGMFAGAIAAAAEYIKSLPSIFVAVFQSVLKVVAEGVNGFTGFIAQGINNLAESLNLNRIDFGDLIDTSKMTGGDVGGVLSNTKANIKSAYDQAAAIDYVTAAQNGLTTATEKAGAAEQTARGNAELTAKAVRQNGQAVQSLVDAYNNLPNGNQIDFDNMLKPSKEEGGKSGSSSLDKTLAEIEASKKLALAYGVEADRQRLILEIKDQLGDSVGKYTEAAIAGAADRIKAYEDEQEALRKADEQTQSIADTLQSSMSNAFMSMVDGTKSFKDAMKDMARSVIKQLFEILVVQRMVGSFNATTGKGSGLVGMIMGAGFADGGAFSGGSQIQAYANGGVVGGPTYFPMAGGKTGLMGEAGPEAIMPLKRGANGKLGVQAEGSSQGNVVVNQSFNFQANGDDSVKKLIAQAAPQIANMTQKQIMDSRRRGGSMKAAFG